VILAVWVTSVALDGMVEGYDPPPIANGLMTFVVTAAFGSGLVHRKNGGDGGS
jgi:hypothetical protein